MDYRKNIIENYLASGNDKLALLVNGEWGSGKTTFIENYFKENKSILVSLNGVRNLNLLTDEILISNDNPLIRIIGGPLVNAVVGIETKFLNTGIVESLKAGFIKKKKSGALLKLKDKVLIFDDLERHSESISIKEVLGYINTTFLNANFKVIIIADETQIKSKKKYLKVKEKYIWQTLDFKANINTLLNQLASKLDSKTKIIIKNNEKYLIELLHSYKIKNLRTIIYYLHCIDKVISNLFETIKNKNLEVLLNSILILVSEFKIGTHLDEKNEVHDYLKKII